MRVLLSSIGTRGDVQPILALALALRALGHESTIVAPPDFANWIMAHGVGFVPMGPPVRKFTPASAGPLQAPSPERQRELASMASMAVRSQFEVLGAAVGGHHVVVAAGALQFAMRSVAEVHGIPYVFAAYCPTVLPSPQHPPAQMGAHHPPTLPESDIRALWLAEERSWDELFGPMLAVERARLGLPAIDGVLRHILSTSPWLAADPVLGPAGLAEGFEVVQTGAWRLFDHSTLPPALEAFLDAGAPPVYLGFGSMRAGPDVGRVLLAAAREVGRRAVVSGGWGGLAPDDAGDDWIAIDDVAHDVLFPRVAAVVHHGGSGTTTSTAMAGRPQVIVPHHYDQPYWGHRIEVLGLGASLPGRPPDARAVAAALEVALRPKVAEQARQTASRLVRDGAEVAAKRLVALVG